MPLEDVPPTTEMVPGYTSSGESKMPPRMMSARVSRALETAARGGSKAPTDCRVASYRISVLVMSTTLAPGVSPSGLAYTRNTRGPALRRDTEDPPALTAKGRSRVAVTEISVKRVVPGSGTPSAEASSVVTAADTTDPAATVDTWVMVLPEVVTPSPDRATFRESNTDRAEDRSPDGVWTVYWMVRVRSWSAPSPCRSQFRL